ncbi:MAG: hypothetical protein KFF73_09465 [Cyclobacteriaceae bacterium]|nr:hypothetical protein [Cyclobacteriaceae bacterium]
MKEKIKIGILVNDNLLPSWIISMLENLANYPKCDLVIILNKDLGTGSNRGNFFSVFSKPDFLLYHFYRSVDRMIFSHSPDAYEQKLIERISSLKNIPQIKVNWTLSDHTDINGIEELTEIQTYNFDFIINFSSSFPPLSFYNYSKNGIWSYQVKGALLTSDSSPIIWDVFDRRNYRTNIKLIKQTIRNRSLISEIIMNVHYTVDKISLNRNINRTYWKVAKLLPQKIREYCENGAEVFNKSLQNLNVNPQFSSGRYNSLKNIDFFVAFFRFSLALLISKLRRFYYFDQWILLFRLGPESNDFSKFVKILPPQDRFYADPFIYKKGEDYYIFMEELIFKQNKGFISVLKIDKNGNYKEPVKVLETDYHLSYPFLLEHKGELYMIPESGDNKTIDLYRCFDFPLKWEYEMTLINNIKAFDSTILCHNGIFWLFTYIVPSDNRPLSQGLYIFFSDNLLSTKWKSHPLNPVVNDGIFSRPGGDFFNFGKNIYRPSQDCSKRYGYGIKINKIIELSETKYEERAVDSIYPDWDKKLVGVHHIRTLENLRIIDAEIKRRRF